MDTEKQHDESQEFTEKDQLKQKSPLGAKKETNDKTFKQKCTYVLQNLTFEPAMILFVLSGIVIITTTQNLSLEKACRVNLNYSAEICHSLRLQEVESQNEYEREIQKLLAKVLPWKTYVVSTVPCATALFAGSYSDKTGHRKVFVIIPIIGQILICLNNIANTYFFDELNLEFLVFSEAVFDGLSGGWCVCFMTMFSFVSVISTEEMRTFRMGLINFAFTVGFPIGMGISGVILNRCGFYGGFLISGALAIINLLYNIFFIKDPKRTPDQILVS
jgi:MFS transporter, PCFT/HCP family, solute carrier family 46, member 3